MSKKEISLLVPIKEVVGGSGSRPLKEPRTFYVFFPIDAAKTEDIRDKQRFLNKSLSQRTDLNSINFHLKDFTLTKPAGTGTVEASTVAGRAGWKAVKDKTALLVEGGAETHLQHQICNDAIIKLIKNDFKVQLHAAGGRVLGGNVESIWLSHAFFELGALCQAATADEKREAFRRVAEVAPEMALQIIKEGVEIFGSEERVQVKGELEPEDLKTLFSNPDREIRSRAITELGEIGFTLAEENVQKLHDRSSTQRESTRKF